MRSNFGRIYTWRRSQSPLRVDITEMGHESLYSSFGEHYRTIVGTLSGDFSMRCGVLNKQYSYMFPILCLSMGATFSLLVAYPGGAADRKLVREWERIFDVLTNSSWFTLLILNFQMECEMYAGTCESGRHLDVPFNNIFSRSRTSKIWLLFQADNEHITR